MILVPFIIFVCINYFLGIHAHITCIVHELGALGVAQKIQVMGSLQDDK